MFNKFPCTYSYSIINKNCYDFVILLSINIYILITVLIYYEIYIIQSYPHRVLPMLGFRNKHIKSFQNLFSIIISRISIGLYGIDYTYGKSYYIYEISQ